MEKDPGNRPQSAREVVQALDDAAAMRTTPARRKLVFVAVAALLLVAAITLLGAIVNWLHWFGWD
jgi:hypothetical protein